MNYKEAIISFLILQITSKVIILIIGVFTVGYNFVKFFELTVNQVKKPSKIYKL